VVVIKNNYEIRGEITAIFLKRKGVITETLISTMDLPIVNSFDGEWKRSYRNGSKEVYVYGSFYVKNSFCAKKENTIIALHRFILNTQKGKMVDHKNHNTLDNTRLNLREVTNAQNQQNRAGVPKNNKSGVMGVSWSKKCKAWCAAITLNGKNVYNKRFKNIVDAEIAIKIARAKLHPYSIN